MGQGMLRRKKGSSAPGFSAAALPGLRHLQSSLPVVPVHVCDTPGQSPGVIWRGLYWQGRFAVSNLSLKTHLMISTVFAEAIWEPRSSMKPLELMFLLLS